MSPSDQLPLLDKHVVITGGGRGIGAAIADAMDTLGANISLMGRSKDVLESKAASLSRAQGITVDVCEEASVKEAFRQARTAYGPVSVLVNSAGGAISAPFQRTETKTWQQMLDVNLSGTFYCSREVVEDMRKATWGRIINIASTAGLMGAPYISAYSAAKHGVIGLTRSLALELAKQGITVNALCPGFTNTDLLEESINNILDKTGMSREEAMNSLKSKNPQNRFIEPEEVAASAKWLCLPGSEGVTGEAISIAGGATQA